jgi:hypothetical protein
VFTWLLQYSISKDSEMQRDSVIKNEHHQVTLNSWLNLIDPYSNEEIQALTSHHGHHLYCFTETYPSSHDQA